MKTTSIVVAVMWIFASSAASADWFGYAPDYAYGYDPVDAAAARDLAAINAQEQADVSYELWEGDPRGAERVIRRDEAIKNQIRRNTALYDQARDMNRYGYGYYGYGFDDDDD